jgi:hypothetical protein
MTGIRLGPEFLVNTTTTSVQLDSAVTALTDGRLAVTWTDERQNGIRAVHSQIFSADGSRS